MTCFNPTDMSLEDSILRNFGGPVINNLNHILGNLDDLNADTEFPSHVTYIDTLSLEKGHSRSVHVAALGIRYI